MPAVNEADKIAIFELLISASSLNASSVINIDIVKPIPPKNPVPVNVFHLMPEGNLQRPMATPVKEKRLIPKGFPINKPAIIPMLLECDNAENISPDNAIQVFAIANKGRIKNATGLCKKRCNKYDGDLVPCFLNGIANASNTPVMVACTPECSIKYHMIIPPTKYGMRL